MTSPILVTGGSGTLGRHVVPRLRDAGCDVQVLSRHRHPPEDGVAFMTGDLATGEGAQAAVAGVGTVVHLAGSAKGDEDKARNLVRAASRAGVRHLVYISVVGADRIPVVSGVDRAMFGYFAAKRAAERVVADSGLPWTMLRATQFHDLVLTVARQLAKHDRAHPRAIAVAFTKAWSSHNLTSAAAYLAEDVVFDGPGGHSVGARAYLEGLTPFAQRTTGMRIIAALDDDDQALIMYEVTIGPSVTVTCAEHLTIRDGKIQAADAVAAALPNASRRTLPGQGHQPAPEAIVPVLVAFLRS